MKISEIFLSIEGEGIRVGLPCIFIRTHGCNMRCSYCDSDYACLGNDYKEMTIDEIIAETNELQCKRVTFTGGEPLLQKEARALVSKLVSEGYEVNIETNGSIDTSEYNELSNVIITMDYKSPSSNMEHMMSIENINKLSSQDVLKFVVGSIEDLDKAKDIISIMTSSPSIYLSPVFGKIEAKDIVEYMLSNHMNNVHVQLQLHKFIWPPEMRGV